MTRGACEWRCRGRRLRRRRRITPTEVSAIAIGCALAFAAAHARAVDSCPFACGDLNGDQVIGIPDFAAFAECLGAFPASSTTCFCADQDGSGAVDLRDYALFTLVFGQASDEAPPACTGAVGSTADLTAFRPQHGAGYAPFARTAVSEAQEEDPEQGPGIRVNASGDVDPAGEDDLIEIVLTVEPPGAALALRRGSGALAVWSTRTKTAGTEIPFIGDKTGPLPLAPAQSALTLWVEWVNATPGIAELHVEPPGAVVPKDTLIFHAFAGLVVALGGEGQTPADPPDPNTGTFVVATELYRSGYDVHMFDEDHVGPDGSGAVYDEVVTAIRDRAISEVGIFGYSHGGGSTYDLADRLDLNRAGIGVFEITYTSYVDSVSNNSDIDTAQELRRPPSSEYHLNHYQHGTLLEDFFLDGGPVPDSHPPPTGLDVETTAWGAGATHFEVDDFPEVRGLMESTLLPRVLR